MATDANPNPDRPEKQKRNAPLWIKILIPFHIVAITAWSLPSAPEQYKTRVITRYNDGKPYTVEMPPRVPLRIRTDSLPAMARSTAECIQYGFLNFSEKYVKDSPLKFYLLSTGFWQYWDMFSPNPSNVDVYCTADVTYRDGTVKRYHYPRIYDFPVWRKFFMERWRKFYERAGSADYRYLWPVFAQRLAEMNASDPNNPPVMVALHRHEFVIKPPGEPPNRAYTDALYFKHPVDQKQLRKDLNW